MMKSMSIIIGLILLLTCPLYSQLKYERTVEAKYMTLKIDDGSSKYIRYNKDEKNVFVYNLDNTLWKTIKLPLPKFHLLDEIKHISVHTFNDDNYLELIYSCVIYKIPNDYDNIGTEFELLEYTLNIINERSELILKVPNSNEMKIINSNGERKLLIYKHLGEHYRGKGETIIYSF